MRRRTAQVAVAPEDESVDALLEAFEEQFGLSTGPAAGPAEKKLALASVHPQPRDVLSPRRGGPGAEPQADEAPNAPPQVFSLGTLGSARNSQESLETPRTRRGAHQPRTRRTPREEPSKEAVAGVLPGGLDALPQPPPPPPDKRS